MILLLHVPCAGSAPDGVVFVDWASSHSAKSIRARVLPRSWRHRALCLAQTPFGRALLSASCAYFSAALSSPCSSDAEPRRRPRPPAATAPRTARAASPGTDASRAVRSLSRSSAHQTSGCWWIVEFDPWPTQSRRMRCTLGLSARHCSRLAARLTSLAVTGRLRGRPI